MALNAPYTTNTVIQSTQVSNDLTGLANGTNDTAANMLNNLRKDFRDYFQTGCIWTTSAGLVGQATAGVYCITGVYYAPVAINSHTFTASKDTYIDYDSSGVPNYTEVANNAASPAMTAGRIRAAIVVTSGAAIGSINQGSITATAPVVSGSVLMVCDSLGNMVYNSDPASRLLGYRQVTATQAGVSAETDLTGLAVTVLVPGNGTKEVEIILSANYDATAADSSPFVSIKEGVTYLNGRGTINANTPTGFKFVEVKANTTPTAGSHTYKGAFQRFAGTGTVSMAANPAAANTAGPAFIKVLLG
jgi:hypothetical protein